MSFEDNPRPGARSPMLQSRSREWSSILSTSPPPHIGLITRDFDRDLRRYAKVFGYRWAKVVSARHELIGPLSCKADVRVTFSVDEPHIELIEHRPGTPWSDDSGALHHLGFWVDDLEQSGAKLTDAGFTFKASGRREGASRIAYAYYSNDNLMIEISDRRNHGYWQKWISTPADE